MNILKSRYSDLNNRFLSALSILSLFCYLFFGFDINNTKAAVTLTNTQGGATVQNTTFSTITTEAQAQQSWEKNAGLYPNSPLNQSSPVITPGAGGSAMIQQSGPMTSANCGISVTGGKWKYCMLAPVNGLIGSTSADKKLEIVDLGVPDPIPSFFSKIYNISIIIAIALSIVYISLGGIRLATADSVSGTDEGRKMAKAALAGLFIALFSYVLLYTINPALVGNGSGSVFPNTTNIPIKSIPGK